MSYQRKTIIHITLITLITPITLITFLIFHDPYISERLVVLLATVGQKKQRIIFPFHPLIYKICIMFAAWVTRLAARIHPVGPYTVFSQLHDHAPRRTVIALGCIDGI